MSYRHGFLISTLAHPPESPFFKSVLYVCEQAPGGSLGIILNKSTQLTVADILKKESDALSRIPVFLGGTKQVQEKGCLLHKPLGRFWEGTLELCSDLHMTTTNDIFKDIDPKDKSNYRVFLGYSSWGPHELEYEVARDLWLFLPYSPAIFWTHPLDLWGKCYQELGLHPSNIGCVDKGAVLPH